MRYIKPKTQPIKGLLIFAGIGVAISLAGIIIFIFDRSNLAISILVYIFGGMFLIGGSAVILDQLFHYVEVKEDKLIHRVFFKKNVLPINKIKKLVLKNGIYEVYSGKKKFCTIPSQVTGAPEIAVALQRQGVVIDEK